MHSKPAPLYSIPARTLCPVCGTPTYSSAGIHPQCAVERADAERMKSAKPVKLEPLRDVEDLKPWQRRCPKCRAVVHVRKKACVCGQALLHSETAADS